MKFQNTDEAGAYFANKIIDIIRKHSGLFSIDEKAAFENTAKSYKKWCDEFGEYFGGMYKSAVLFQHIFEAQKAVFTALRVKDRWATLSEYPPKKELDEAFSQSVLAFENLHDAVQEDFSDLDAKLNKFIDENNAQFEKSIGLKMSSELDTVLQAISVSQEAVGTIEDSLRDYKPQYEAYRTLQALIEDIKKKFASAK